MKQALQQDQAVAGIASLLFLLAPVTDMGILVCLAALAVAIIAGVTGHHLSDDEDNRKRSGSKDPNPPSWICTAIGEIRWDEKAGLRRDAVRSQVIDALEGARDKGDRQ